MTCAVQEGPASALAGLRFPDLPDGAVGRRVDPPSVLVVHRGDSLWTMAREQLTRAHDDAAICRAVDALYAANRAVIGPDPNLILPGTELTPPGGTP